MRKLQWLAAVGLIVAAGAATAVACGDKFPALGHGQRFNTAARPASLVLYVDQKDLKSTLGRKDLQSVLKQAGHKLEVVDDVAKLETDVTSGKFDLALVDYAEALALAEHVKAAAAITLIVPVMGDTKRTEYAAAAREFPYLVKSGDPSQYLTTIDQAMKSRARN